MKVLHHLTADTMATDDAKFNQNVQMRVEVIKQFISTQQAPETESELLRFVHQSFW